MDVLTEGWEETYSDTEASIQFDTSPADTPAMFVWSDSTYGVWQPDGATLTAGINSGVNTLQITSQAGTPTFTTSAGAYPLKITIGSERLRLNNPPGGSTSPQTFTGVTRGVDGTTAAAHTTGDGVTLWPESAWAL
jgi:hypothetical protein